MTTPNTNRWLGNRGQETKISLPLIPEKYNLISIKVNKIKAALGDEQYNAWMTQVLCDRATNKPGGYLAAINRKMIELEDEQYILDQEEDYDN